MDDEAGPGWRIDADVRSVLRVERVRAAFAQGDLTEAIIEAEELLDEVPGHADGLFLLGESLLESGDAEGAAQAYAQHLATGRVVDQAFVGLALARFDLCDVDGAVEAAREAIRRVPDAAEAHYTLALALERDPARTTETLASFAVAQRLDPEAYPFPVQLSDDQWSWAVQQALESIAPDFQAFWSGVPIALLDLPSLDELRRADPPISPSVSGLYEGEPPDDLADPARPARMRLFRLNLARMGSIDAVIDQIASTLEREAADWLGLVEQDEGDGDGDEA